MTDTVRQTVDKSAKDAPDDCELNAAGGDRADISGVGALVEVLADLQMRSVCIRINAKETITFTGVPAEFLLMGLVAGLFGLVSVFSVQVH